MAIQSSDIVFVALCTIIVREFVRSKIMTSLVCRFVSILVLLHHMLAAAADNSNNNSNKRVMMMMIVITAM